MKQPKKSQHDDNMTRLYQNHIDINNAKKVLGRNNYKSVNKVFENKKLYENLHERDKDDNASARLNEAHNDCDNERSNYDNTRLDEAQDNNDDNDSTRLNEAHNDCDNERSNYDNVSLDEAQADNDERLDGAHDDNDESLDGAHDDNDERIMKPSVNLIEASLSQDAGTSSSLSFFYNKF